MNEAHRTTITRPRRPQAAAASSGRSDPSRFGDLTRPIQRDRQLVKGRGKRVLIVVATVVVAGALAAALFVLPVQSWFRQRHDIETKQRQLAVLTAANAELTVDVNRLQTNDGIRDAAREEIGYVSPGEQRVTVMPAPAAPLALPAGWPYDGVNQILAVRLAAPTASTAPPSDEP